MNTYSVIQKFDPVTDYFKDPYPHIIIKDCLPQQTYELLYENFPVQTIKDKFPLMEGHTRRGNANEFLGENKIEIKQPWFHEKGVDEHQRRVPELVRHGPHP